MNPASLTPDTGIDGGAAAELAATADRSGPPRRFKQLGRLVAERSLVTQTVGAGLLAAAIVALAWGAWHPSAAQATAAAALSGALLATLACTLFARRQALALQQISAASRLLRRDDAPDTANIPLIGASAEMTQATMRLRRMVEAARERRLALLELNAQLGRQLQARTHELSTLQDLSMGLASKTDLHELVDEALKALEQTLDYASASVWSRDRSVPAEPVVLMGYRRADADEHDSHAGNLLGMRLSRPNVRHYEQIEREREPIIENHARQSLLSWLWDKLTDDARTSALYRTTRAWMGVPLKFHDHVLGVLRVDHQETGYFDRERARLLTAVCSQTALAMRHAELQAKEREVAVAAERNRIARELHDAVSQTLFAANLLAGTLARAATRNAGPGTDAVRRQAQTLERLNRGALAEMRMLMYELRPDALDTTPLHELLQLAIEAMVCRGEVQVDAAIARGDELPPATRTQVYRIAQEALTNIARHSGATRAEVHWHAGADGARLRIADNGRGFDPATPRPGHFGLGHMAERAAEIGARLALHSAPGEGTELTLELT